VAASSVSASSFALTLLAGTPAQLRQAGVGASRVGADHAARALLQRARALVSAPEHRAARFEVDLSLGEIFFRIGQFDDCVGLLEALLPEARAANDRPVLAKALGNLLRTSIARGDDKAANTFLDEALPLARELGDSKELVFILRQAGNFWIADPDKARPPLEESLAIAQRIGDRDGEAFALNSLGNFWASWGDPAKALTLYERCLQIAREEGVPSMLCLALGNVGACLVQIGELERAESTLRDHLKVAEEIKERVQVAAAHENLGWLYVRMQGNDAARMHLGRSLAAYDAAGVKAAYLLYLFAVVEARTGNRERALEWVGLARALAVNPSQLEIYSIHLPEIHGDLAEAEIQAAYARGAQLDWNQVAKELLRGSGEIVSTA